MNIQDLFDSFSSKTILVVGDVMIDSYVIGRVTRISPEAPVPIIELTKKEDRLGGAANVALNLKALGANVIMASIIGQDNAAKTIVDLFQESDIHFDTRLESNTRKTTVKTRVLGNKQQLLRIDDEQVNDINFEEEELLIQFITETITNQKIDAIIFEDYNKGVLTSRVIDEVIKIANENNVITTVDPKKHNFFQYKNVTLFKPNLKELREGLNSEINIREDLSSLQKAIQQLENQLSNQITFITLSELGVFIKSKDEDYHFPAHLRDIADVSGAGDTVISVATLCLTANCNISDVAFIANIAGGLVCEEMGVVSINKDKLYKEVIRLMQ